MIPVDGHSRYHVRRGEHPDHLQVFDASAHGVGASEPARNFHGKLREDLEKRDHQISQAQMQEEQVCPCVSFALLPKCAHEEEVTTCCEHEYQTQNARSDERKAFSHIFVLVCCLSRAVTIRIHLKPCCFMYAFTSANI